MQYVLVSKVFFIHIMVVVCLKLPLKKIRRLLKNTYHNFLLFPNLSFQLKSLHLFLKQCFMFAWLFPKVDWIKIFILCMLLLKYTFIYHLSYGYGIGWNLKGILKCFFESATTGSRRSSSGLTIRSLWLIA